MKCPEYGHRVFQEVLALIEQGPASEHSHHTDVHGVSYILIKTPNNEMPGRINRGRRTPSSYAKVIRAPYVDGRTDSEAENSRIYP